VGMVFGPDNQNRRRSCDNERKTMIDATDEKRLQYVG
jgi:hypothetical protein